MTKQETQALEAAIVADLANLRLTYLHIALRQKVGYVTVAMSKKHSLTRTRGRKKSSLLSVVEG